MAERCLSLVIDPQTSTVLATSSSPLALFGHDVASLPGRSVAPLLDVLGPEGGTASGMEDAALSTGHACAVLSLMLARSVPPAP